MKLEDDRRSLSGLFVTALTQLSLLAQTEIRMARVEIGQKVTTVGVAIGLIGAAAVFAIPGLTLLLFAAAAWLTGYGLSVAAADAIVGAGALVLTGLLMVMGLNRLRGQTFKPQRTLVELQRDAAVAKEHFT